MLAGISPPKSECKSNAFFITLQMFLKIFFETSEKYDANCYKTKQLLRKNFSSLLTKDCLGLFKSIPLRSSFYPLFLMEQDYKCKIFILNIMLIMQEKYPVYNFN